eukprot:TRINITY_DN9544_c0_g1_i1.p1 TRINITY_DN9544_c0_g1~~TRINITY_DN9544_c0_g1_i1.p1  ORF type:complete len:227 (-),score=78.53 TRINITY_DN9544_c0_g1_i1:45-701(-)
MAEIFNDYHKRFKQLTQKISQSIASLPASLDKKKEATAEIDKDLSRANQLLQYMESAAKNAPGYKKAETILRESDGELSSLRQRLNQSSFAPSVVATDQFRDQDHANMETANQRTKLVANTSRLVAMQERTQRIDAVGRENLIIAEDTLVELKNQGERLEKIPELLDEADANVKKGKYTLIKMMGTAVLNQVILFMIILILAFLLVVLVWQKFFNFNE